MISFSSQASDFYITKSDLNIRSGAGTNFKSLNVLEKGDTVKLLEKVNDYWAKIQYNDKDGYVAISYLQPIEIKTIETETSNEEDHPFITFLVLLAIVITLAIILKHEGNKYRKKSITALLSFFFGAFGLQKFYLGESNNGIISIIFCWTFIPLIIGFIDFIIFATINEVKFNTIYNYGKKPQETSTSKIAKPRINQQNFQRNASTYQMSQNQQMKYVTDKSIIDVSDEKLDLTVEKDQYPDDVQIEPPYWGHTYVYSFDEIRNANPSQKKYYNYLKNKVLNGEIVDIQGNTNYAFILYFDFLNEYQGHRDIKLLETQFKLIGQICPKTKNYTFRLLQDELRKRNDPYSIDKLKNLEETGYQLEYGYTVYDPDLYKLGNKYKNKLGLDKQEIIWLNKFYNPSNVFLSIEGCCVATIMHYVTILKELDKRLKKAETTLVKEVTYFKEKLKNVYANRNSEWGYYDSTYLGDQAESDVYLTLFKRVENSVRENFGHKRKVSGDFPYAGQNLSDEFENRIGRLFNLLIEELKSNLIKPDLETQIALNIQNVTRWQIEFDELKKSFKPELKSNFNDGIIHLEETNQKNPNIENIFFEASKFIAIFDKVLSLSYYAKYIYYDLKSRSFDNKELSKTVHKSLFKTQDQLETFKAIISELIQSSDIQTALEKITQIYIPTRKRIHLNKSEIKEIVEKHEETVELLNEYLNSEKEETITEINLPSEDTEVTIISPEEKNSIFNSEISLGKVQEELIKKIASNSFKIYQFEVDKFASENQMFKNQIIDSINESCTKFLDGEALIEEDGENYIMEESYYKIITK
ncbi:MAG: NINE protein [Ignavibacteriales bacterium]|nr:NINE protein [Ignavibacteriales bacterium]